MCRFFGSQTITAKSSCDDLIFQLDFHFPYQIFFHYVHLRDKSYHKDYWKKSQVNLCRVCKIFPLHEPLSTYTRKNILMKSAQCFLPSLTFHLVLNSFEFVVIIYLLTHATFFCPSDIEDKKSVCCTRTCFHYQVKACYIPVEKNGFLRSFVSRRKLPSIWIRGQIAV